MTSIQRPKQFSFIGTDGIEYNFLAKSGDDLCLDARVSELFRMFDHFLATDHRSRDRKLSVRSYHVVPLGDKKGLIEWIPDLMGFKECCRPSYQRVNKLPDLGWKIQPLQESKEARIMSYKKQLLKSSLLNLCLTLAYSPPVFHEWFLDTFSTPNECLEARKKYMSSLAVTSVIGNIIGLGDRHGDNVTICQKTGEVVHIDLNMIFERGRSLRVPEIVPFRLTPNIVDGCGIAKLNGLFRKVALVTMEIAQDKKEMIKTIMSLFLLDPTINWDNCRQKKDNRQQQSVGGAKKDGGDNDEQIVTNYDITKLTAKDLKNVIKRLICVDGDVPLTREDYLDGLLKKAQDPMLLALMWPGWAPHL